MDDSKTYEIRKLFKKVYWETMKQNYTFLVLLIVGSIGNGLSFMLMMQKSVRSTPFGYYLAHVAVADTGYLYFGAIPVILKNFNVGDIFGLHNLTCKFGKFLQYSSGDFAIWLVLAVTVDRFIAVKYPFKHKTFSTLSKAKWICVMLFFLACIFNSYLFVTRGLVIVSSSIAPICGTLTSHSYFETYIRPWYNIIGLIIIPGGTMLILNALIVMVLWHESLSRKLDSPVSPQVIRTTITLLAVSMMFIVLVCPCFVMISFLPYLNLSSIGIQYVITVCLALIYINHSCNIFLYVLTSKQFRDTLMKWFCGCGIQK